LRLRGYDYASPGAYFVTICTEQRSCLFGDVSDGAVSLSAAGVVIDSWWNSIPTRFPDVVLDTWVVMPNHIHGIILIGTDPNVAERASATLPEVVRWFKSHSTRDYILGVKTEGWPRFPKRLWQQGFYDHIVRDDRSLDRIRAYIKANPDHWADDEYQSQPG
jgi:REP element-mobilizing transposase RayT